MKVIAGNPGRRPLPDNEPQPPIDTAEPPERFDGDARREWHRVAPKLRDCGILTELDRPALSLYCESYARYREASRILADAGMIVDGKPNPALTAVRAEVEIMRKFMVEFGMTPSSRTRVRAVPPGAGPDEWDKFA